MAARQRKETNVSWKIGGRGKRWGKGRWEMSHSDSNQIACQPRDPGSFRIIMRSHSNSPKSQSQCVHTWRYAWDICQYLSTEFIKIVMTPMSPREQRPPWCIESVCLPELVSPKEQQYSLPFVSYSLAGARSESVSPACAFKCGWLLK